ncbi:unnamed protein product [Echinostoma caproni]|uniref:Uncharacterized protein n=1 Tax=Echinostoma caproni TaxID=27848 RepID=A0A183B688_9TREM|nr:unnamed protein product [Echinostoma caproni]
MDRPSPVVVIEDVLENEQWQTLNIANEHKPTAVAVSESWLVSHGHVPSLAHEAYEVHRQDRSQQLQGGGVLILARKDIQQVQVDIEVCTSNIQMCSVTIAA